MKTKKQVKLVKMKRSQRLYQIGRELLKKEFAFVKTEFNHMDLFGFNFGGDSCEIEVKVADYDFYKEFNKFEKQCKHSAYKNIPEVCPTRFYFLVLHNMAEKALRKIEAELPKYGLITWCPYEDQVRILKKSERLSEVPFQGDLLARPFSKYQTKKVAL